MEKHSLILVVEDEPTNAELLEILLSRKNLKYIIAYDGNSALELFNQREDIRLVLLDIKLPGMTGEEVLQEMKARRPEIPVVVQTAYVFNTDKDYFFQLGCDDYLKKPLNRQQLYNTINRYIQIEID